MKQASKPALPTEMTVFSHCPPNPDAPSAADSIMLKACLMGHKLINSVARRLPGHRFDALVKSIPPLYCAPGGSRAQSGRNRHRMMIVFQVADEHPVDLDLLERECMQVG